MNHDHYLNLAAQAASKIDPHRAAPNPRVGCVVVQAGEVISVGAHQQYGQAHAEVEALSQLDPAVVAKSIIYITLEPCVNFEGKHTPACTDLLRKLKPAQVIVGSLDPHFPGQGLAALQQAGIKAALIASGYHQNLNPWFATWTTAQRPFVTLKVAQSLDGRITNGQRHLTNNESRQAVHLMRAEHAAILTTTATVLADDPQLNVRLEQAPDFPTTNPDIIIMGQSGLPGNLALHRITGRQIHPLQSRDFNTLISLCREKRISSILTECGGIMNSALLEAGLVDQIELFIAPVHVGASHIPSFAKTQTLKNFELVSTQSLGSDLQLTYRRLRVWSTAPSSLGLGLINRRWVPTGSPSGAKTLETVLAVSTAWALGRRRPRVICTVPSTTSASNPRVRAAAALCSAKRSSVSINEHQTELLLLELKA